MPDFGSSKVIEVGEANVSSEVRGTFGYVDPDHVNSSGDVYSFGMVLLQILSGKKAINLKLKKPLSLSRMVQETTSHKFLIFFHALFICFNLVSIL